MYIARADIERAAKSAPPGYRDLVYAGRIVSHDRPTSIDLPDDRYAVIKAFKTEPAAFDVVELSVEWMKAVLTEAMPRAEWPAWAKWIAKYESPQDRGIGDTVERMLGAGGRIFKTAFEALSISCGCDQRREDWNAKYTYHRPQITQAS